MANQDLNDQLDLTDACISNSTPTAALDPDECPLLSLPLEIRSQIWDYAFLPSDLRFCTCLTEAYEYGSRCSCTTGLIDAPVIPSTIPSSTPITARQIPKFAYLPSDIAPSGLPLVCRKVYHETRHLMPAKRPPRVITVCSSTCLSTLLSLCQTSTLKHIHTVRILVDLRTCQKPGELPSFEQIWVKLYRANWELSDLLRDWVGRTGADVLEKPAPAKVFPELKFYPLNAEVRGRCRPPRPEVLTDWA